MIKEDIDFNEFLTERNLPENAITSSQTEIGLKSIKLIDEINQQLMHIGISIEYYLSRRGKSLVQMRYTNLEKFNKVIAKLMVDNPEFSVNDVLQI